MNTRVLIFNCNNINTLPIIRSLGIKNIKTDGLFWRRPNSNFYGNLVYFTKYLDKKYFLYDPDYESGLIKLLLDISKQQKQKSVLFLASDQDMIITSKNRDALKDYFTFTLPAHNLLEKLLNKEKFIELANENNLPIPKSQKISSINNIYEVIKQFEFPFIIKPSWRDDNWLNKFNEQKILYINSYNDIESNIYTLKTFDSNFLIQEIIPGSERNIFCSFAILDHLSNPIEIGYCQKIRQRPAYFGNTSAAEPIINKELEELSLKIFKQLGLKGYASIEYKMDPRDGNLKIMEITPNRFNRQFAVTNLAGLNLPFALYNFELNINLEQGSVLFPKGYWLSEVNEIRTLFYYLWKKELKLSDWFLELRSKKVFEIFDKNDIKPFISFIINLFIFPIVYLVNSIKRLFQ